MCITSSMKVFLQLEHQIELLFQLQNQYQDLLYLKMSLLVANSHI